MDCVTGYATLFSVDELKDLRRAMHAGSPVAKGDLGGKIGVLENNVRGLADRL